MFIFTDSQYEFISWESSVISVLKLGKWKQRDQMICLGFFQNVLMVTYIWSLGSVDLKVDTRLYIIVFPHSSLHFSYIILSFVISTLAPMIIIKATLKAKEMVTHWLTNGDV